MILQVAYICKLNQPMKANWNLMECAELQSKSVFTDPGLYRPFFDFGVCKKSVFYEKGLYSDKNGR